MDWLISFSILISRSVDNRWMNLRITWSLINLLRKTIIIEINSDILYILFSY